MRFLRFGLVGAVSTVITFAVFNLIAVLLHEPAILGHVVGWIAGFINSFAMNRSWTFKDRAHLTNRQVMPRFAVSNLAALGASSAVLVSLESVARSAGLFSEFPEALVLNGVAVAAVSVSLLVNYALLVTWTFRDRTTEPAEKGSR